MKKQNKELKTLKDIEEGEFEGEVYKEDVKQEAIKHYKAVRNGSLTLDVLSYIMWANNITKEDLKDA